MQNVIVIVIVAASFGYAAFRIYRFLRPGKSAPACEPEKCGACPYGGNDRCSAGEGERGPSCPEP